MAGEALSRPDGRAGNQIRPLVCTRSLLSRADGSAQWSQGTQMPMQNKQCSYIEEFNAKYFCLYL
jgi:exosome complex RNA-binding protein Rrp42 (RNase PH superfamily)